MKGLGEEKQDSGL